MRHERLARRLLHINTCSLCTQINSHKQEAQLVYHSCHAQQDTEASRIKMCVCLHWTAGPFSATMTRSTWSSARSLAISFKVKYQLSRSS